MKNNEGAKGIECQPVVNDSGYCPKIVIVVVHVCCVSKTEWVRYCCSKIDSLALGGAFTRSEHYRQYGVYLHLSRHGIHGWRGGSPWKCICILHTLAYPHFTYGVEYVHRWLIQPWRSCSTQYSSINNTQILTANSTRSSGSTLVVGWTGQACQGKWYGSKVHITRFFQWERVVRRSQGSEYLNLASEIIVEEGY